MHFRRSFYSLLKAAKALFNQTGLVRKAHFRTLIFLITVATSNCSHANVRVQNDVHQLDQVIADLCNHDVALLGEATHGSGVTFEVKIELTKRLVNECHYNAFFIESGIYDFLHFKKRLIKGEANPSDIEKGIGGIWNVQEMMPLISFLYESASVGKLILGGLDDQIGRGTYAATDMTTELLDYLAVSERVKCQKTLQKYMRWEYTEQDPYGIAALKQIQQCILQIKKAVSTSEKYRAEKDKDEYITQNLLRFFRHEQTALEDFTNSDSGTEAFNDRDQMMYENFKWLRSRLPEHSKVIIWSHDVHVAKELPITAETNKNRQSLGSLIHHEIQDKMFALSFSAISGSYGMLFEPKKFLDVAPIESLEGQSFKSERGDTHYVNHAFMSQLKSIMARPINYEWMNAQWNKIYDGMFIIKVEHPPHKKI